MFFNAILKKYHNNRVGVVFKKDFWMRFSSIVILCALGVGTLFSPARAYNITTYEIQKQKLESDSMTAKAIRAALNDDYKTAKMLVKKSENALLKKIIEWIRLTSSDKTLTVSELTKFMEKNPEWPRIYMMRNNVERILLRENNASDIEKWFKKYPPISGNATLRQIDLLMAKKDWEKAIPMFYQLWRLGELTDHETRIILNNYGFLLKTHDFDARIKVLLDNKNTKQAEQLLDYASPIHKLVAKIRIALIKNDKNARRKISDLPEKYKTDSSLVLDELRWLRVKGEYDLGLSLLKKSPIVHQTGSKWWTERFFLIRQMLNKESNKDAYELAKNHAGLSDVDYADAEWMAGWIALRKLKRTDEAMEHFQNMLKNVKSPISIAKGEYWIARTFEIKKNTVEAFNWYKKAAEKITTIYGQQAAKKINILPDLPIEQRPTEEQLNKIRKQELFQVIKILQGNGIDSLIDTFLIRYFTDLKLSEDMIAASYLLAEDLNRPDLAVSMSRRARMMGTYVTDLGYPILNTNHDSRLEHALVLSIIRQESNFSTNAISPVGARGLMQVMPATAKLVAKKKKKKMLSVQMLNNNPEFNVEVGSTYLADLVKKFNGSYIMAIAAYNAGPNNVKKWVRNFGKPGEDLDSIDWIEMIPFNETRNYVQRVLENLHIYRRLFNVKPSYLSVWNVE